MKYRIIGLGFIAVISTIFGHESASAGWNGFEWGERINTAEKKLKAHAEKNKEPLERIEKNENGLSFLVSRYHLNGMYFSYRLTFCEEKGMQCDEYGLNQITLTPEDLSHCGQLLRNVRATYNREPIFRDARPFFKTYTWNDRDRGNDVVFWEENTKCNLHYKKTSREGF